MIQEDDHERVTLNDFSMLSQIGIGNYAKVILVRKKNNGKVYAMKIIKKGKEVTGIKGAKKEHAYIEKELLVIPTLSSTIAIILSSSNCILPSNANANYTTSLSIVQGDNSLA